MKVLFTIIVLFVFVGCEQNTVKSTTEKPPASLKLDLDTTKLNNHKKLSNRDSFLLKPFDLHEFKRIKKGANSGVGRQKDYYFKPSYKGIYYHFFIFGSGGNCYIEKDTLFRENGLNIITYKPLGKYQNEYLDPTEELIYLEAHCNDFNLPELAFIGLDTSEIKSKLGTFSFKKDNCAVYTYQNKALILGLSNSKIGWLKYIYMNQPLIFEEDLKVKEIYSIKK
jgi:hypothetical protein